MESFDFRRMVREYIAEAAYRDKAPVDVEKLTTNAIDAVQKYVADAGTIDAEQARMIALHQI